VRLLDLVQRNLVLIGTEIFPSFSHANSVSTSVAKYFELRLKHLNPYFVISTGA
jgi:hypothetical protein